MSSESFCFDFALSPPLSYIMGKCRYTLYDDNGLSRSMSRSSIHIQTEAGDEIAVYANIIMSMYVLLYVASYVKH